MARGTFADALAEFFTTAVDDIQDAVGAQGKIDRVPEPQARHAIHANTVTVVKDPPSRSSCQHCSLLSVDIGARAIPLPNWVLRAALDEVKLLKIPAHNRDRVQPQPLLHHGGIETPEVIVGCQVALLQVGGPERWILAVHTALDAIADDKSRPTGAVVSARAVVVHAAAELGKQHHDQVVASVMFPQVIETVLAGRGDV